MTCLWISCLWLVCKLHIRIFPINKASLNSKIIVKKMDLTVWKTSKEKQGEFVREETENNKASQAFRNRHFTTHESMLEAPLSASFFRFAPLLCMWSQFFLQQSKKVVQAVLCRNALKKPHQFFPQIGITLENKKTENYVWRWQDLGVGN